MKRALVLAALLVLSGGTCAAQSFSGTTYNNEIPQEVFGTVGVSTMPPVEIRVSTPIAIKGADGDVVTSAPSGIGSNVGLHVISQNRPSLAGMTFTYHIDNDMAVGSTATISGLGKLADLQAVDQACTYTIDSGQPILVKADTSEPFDLDYVISNPQVHLVSKVAGATCKVRITGAKP